MTIDPNSTKLYAPQARLVDLASGTVVGSTQVVSGGTPVTVVSPDIVSAKVTLTNTGIGQLNVTLNNQRFVNGFGASPPWKYNDFSRPLRNAGPSTDGLGGIAFGKLLRLDMRYGESSWVKMIVAQVNDLQYSFPASGGAQLQVVGEDILCRLKVKPGADKNYQNKQEEQIVREVLTAAYTGPGALPTFNPISNAASDEGRAQPLRSLRHTKTVTYFQFLQEIAERLDYEMFVEFVEPLVNAGATSAQASPGPITVASELEFFFQLARSQFVPQGTLQDGLSPGTDAGAPPVVHYELRAGRNLIDFTPKFKMWDLPTTAEALGTNHGRRARASERLEKADLDALMNAELPATPNYDVPMKNALLAREDFFGDLGAGAESNESSSGTNLDAPRLKRKAGAAFLKKVREFMTADGSVIGLPRLRPGNYVDIVGLRPPFDGYYYVTKTVHSLDSSGYKTQFSVRRPGMMPPERYLTATPRPPAAESAAPGALP